MKVALGIDVGTGSTKAGLVDADGHLLAVGCSSNRLAESRPGWSEADPALWLTAAAAAVAEAMATATSIRPVESGFGPVEVVAVGLSGQMHGVVLCGSGVEPLRPAVLWSDRRSEPDLGGLTDRLDPDLRARLANPIVAGMAGPTLAALRRLEPGLVDRIVKVLQPKDWVRAHLTGEVTTEPSDASATLLWDIEADRWSEAALELFDVDPGWLPPVVPSDSVAGRLHDDGAALFGLAPGLPVAAGAADTASALLGAGLSVGRTQLSTGTGGQLARMLDRPVVDPYGRTHLFRDARSGWYAMAAIQNAGLAIDWATGVLGVGPDAVAAAMASVAPGADGVTFLPYLTGERTPHLDATLTGRWIGLRPTTSRSALVRSVFEGVAFAIRDGLDAMRAAGHPIEQAMLAGGGSVAPWWRQLLADALALPLVPHDVVDASVRGAGLLAWAAIGVDLDPAEAVAEATPIEPSAGRGATDLAEARARFQAAGPAGLARGLG